MFNGFGWSLYMRDGKIVRAKISTPMPIHFSVYSLDKHPSSLVNIDYVEGMEEEFLTIGFNDNPLLETLAFDVQYCLKKGVKVKHCLLSVTWNAILNEVQVEIERQSGVFHRSQHSLQSFLKLFEVDNSEKKDVAW